MPGKRPTRARRANVPPKGAVNRLETVSNTATTTSADYLGCYLPFLGTYQFFKGLLAHATWTGALFLAHELNLVALEVLSAVQLALEIAPPPLNFPRPLQIAGLFYFPTTP